jgi:hypothetical protein
MLANRTRVLLVLPGDLLDRARVLAGKAIMALRLPVSLQSVLRALIGEELAGRRPRPPRRRGGTSQGGPRYPEPGRVEAGKLRRNAEIVGLESGSG